MVRALLEYHEPPLFVAVGPQAFQVAVKSAASVLEGDLHLVSIRKRGLVDDAGCFRHQLLLPSHYLVLTKPLRLDIQCQRGASVKIGWKYLDD